MAKIKGFARMVPLWIIHGVTPGYERVWGEISSLEEYGTWDVPAPSIRHLAKTTGLSERTVTRAITELKGIGALQSIRTGRSSRYIANPIEPGRPGCPNRSADVADQISHIGQQNKVVETKQRNTLSGTDVPVSEKSPTGKILEIWRRVWENPGYQMDGREGKAAKDCWNFVKDRPSPLMALEELFRLFKARAETDPFWNKPTLKTINAASRQLSSLSIETGKGGGVVRDDWWKHYAGEVAQELRERGYGGKPDEYYRIFADSSTDDLRRASQHLRNRNVPGDATSTDFWGAYLQDLRIEFSREADPVRRDEHSGSVPENPQEVAAK